MSKITKIFKFKKELAQSAAELAIFGGVLVFVISSIARLGLSNTTAMNIQLKVFRMALSESYRTAEGSYAPGSQDYFAARNTGSILLLEDRLSVDPAQTVGSRDRIPFMALGNGTFSKNLFFTPDAGDAATQIPLYDVIINGQRFPFTTAGIKTVAITGPVYTAVPNGAASKDWCPTCADRFDLDRDGTIDVAAADRASFGWQWKQETNLDPETGNASVDVDNDLKEETIIELFGGTVLVMDNQEGDIDFTRGSSDPEEKKFLDRENYMKSVTEFPTSLRIQQGTLLADGVQYVKSSSWQQHSDLVERVFFLANDTNRFCRADATPAPTVAGLPNPVAFCSPSAACPNCFSAGCRTQTCMDKQSKVIFIRSQIRDLRGRRWLTKVTP